MLVLFNTSIAFAENNTDTPLQQLQQLQDKYDFEIIDTEDLPENVTPLEVDSIEELENILKSENTCVEEIHIDLTDSININDNITVTPMGLWPSQPATHYYTISSDDVHRLVSEVAYYYAWDDYYNKFRITGIRYKSIYFTWNINHLWEQENYTATISSDTTKINVSVRGNLYAYIAYSGNSIKILKKRINLSYSISR